MVVKDAMVLIHLSKTELLEQSCDLFGHVCVPRKVHDEVMLGESRYLNATLLRRAVDAR